MTFQKGISGNPAGRPKANGTLKNRIEKALGIGEMEPDHLEAIIQELIELAKNGDIRAISLLFDRLDGKAIQQVLTAEIERDEIIDI
jgi:phage head maturation protease